MHTVREALELPVFSSSILVAGRAGLSNEIHWVHIVDIPEAHYEWHRSGVLLLTAGYGLRDNVQSQEALVPTLVERGFAGMVLSTGYYFDHAPPVILEAADVLNFPVVEAPPDLLFIEVTEAVLERIVNRQYTLLQQSTHIYAQLTELVLQGAGLEALASTLAQLLERSVTIEDPDFRVLAAAEHGVADAAREESVQNGRTPPVLAQHLLDAGIYKQLLQQMGPIYVPPMPDHGMLMERFVAPIIVGGEIHGYIWIIAGGRPLTDLDEMAVRHTATVAALILFKDLAVREAEESLRGDFFEQLLEGSGDSAVFAEQARRLHFRPERVHQVLLIQASAKAGGDTRALFDQVERWLRQQGLSPLLVRRERQLVLVLESDDAGAGKELATRLVQALNHPAQRLLVGVGATCGAALDEGQPIRRGHEEAVEAVRIGRALGRQEGVVAFAELGLLHWLFHLAPEKRSGNVYIKHVEVLADYDEERDTELVKTVETYLDYGGSLVDAAEALYIHRNTLLHRLKRIEELCGADLHDPWQQLNLHVAVKSYRLHHGSGG